LKSSYLRNEEKWNYLISVD